MDKFLNPANMGEFWPWTCATAEQSQLSKVVGLHQRSHMPRDTGSQDIPRNEARQRRQLLRQRQKKGAASLHRQQGHFLIYGRTSESHERQEWLSLSFLAGIWKPARFGGLRKGSLHLLSRSPEKSRKVWSREDDHQKGCKPLPTILKPACGCHWPGQARAGWLTPGLTQTFRDVWSEKRQARWPWDIHEPARNNSLVFPTFIQTRL